MAGGVLLEGWADVVTLSCGCGCGAATTVECRGRVNVVILTSFSEEHGALIYLRPHWLVHLFSTLGWWIRRVLRMKRHSGVLRFVKLMDGRRITVETDGRALRPMRGGLAVFCSRFSVSEACG